nr:CheR family methyltransferase [Pseudomonas mosselii]
MKSSSKSPLASPHNPALSPSHLDFPVVGIGASAGGLEAIRRFFQHTPDNSGMAFVVVLHLSPDHQSQADRIIQAVTRMPVRQVSEPVPIERNHVYVISPANRLSTNDGYLRVSPAKRNRGDHVAIDLFFRDLADVHKDHAFCVVLSGTGSDGAVGLSRIKEQGGLTLVQAPEDAEYPDMPRAALATGMVDLLLPVDEMPARLVELWRTARQVKLPEIEDDSLPPPLGEREGDPAASDPLLDEILLTLQGETGHDFSHYKRATVLRRLERRLHVTGQTDLAGYLDFLQRHPEESRALLADMLIGVTNFFRDREAFEALQRHVMPGLVNTDASEESAHEVRIWSAGCSTGEEAYSLAMLVAEQLAVEQRSVQVQVFATDLDERAIGLGRAGQYPDAIATDVSAARLRQFFIKEDQHFRVRKEIREKVLFARHNLLSDPPFSQLDLIVCRNLLIYLDRDVQRDILRLFHFALRPGGHLFLGSSESTDLAADLFVAVDKRNRIFRAREVQTTSHPARLQAPEPALASPARARSSRRLSYAEIHHRALARCTPPSLVVDTEGNILHMSEGVGRFLRHAGGELSHNLLNLVIAPLRPALRSTLLQAQGSGQAVTSRRVEVNLDEYSTSVQILIQPHQDDPSGTDCLLVVFQSIEVDGNAGPSPALEQSEGMLLTNLERELHRTRLQLQETIEQSEFSSQELTASNEEMQAINEELRSASEELETSKEELQSINEELLTVNYELKTKVEETDKVNDYLSNLIASTDIATVFVDRNLCIRWFTPRATDIFSMLPVDTGRSLLDITHRLDYPGLADDARAVVERETTIEREVLGHNQHWYLARLLPYRASERHVDGTVLTFIDISQSRAAEERLRQGEERMRLVAESTHDFAIILLDEQGLITDWNTGAALIFGYGKDEVLGRHYQLIFTEQDQASGVPERELRSARLHGRGQDERWHVRKDGSRFYCSGEVSRLKGSSLRGYVKIARDLTGHKRLHDEQSKQLAESQSTSHMKDEFFAVMSHELKHPLNLIQLNAEILRRSPSVKAASAASKAIGVICDAVSSQARIIDDLLDVARIRTGKLKLKTQVIDLGTVLQGIHAVVLNEQHPCAVRLALPADGAPVHVEADGTRLEQIIWNLLNNALKFSPAGSEIRVVLARQDAHARLEVIDQGVGLTEDSLESVFDLFTQAAPQLSGNRDGLGIGLSLVRQLVEAHGGTVAAYSPGLGCGTTFTVCLPLCAPGRQAPNEASGQTSDGRLDGVKVLLVDDSVEILEVMQQLLEMEGAQVEAYSYPQAALEAAASGRYDIILSDIGMPVMDGHALIKALRALGHLRYTPAIALTGYGASADQYRSRQSGFDRHLSKPVGYDDLIEAIETLCGSEPY